MMEDGACFAAELRRVQEAGAAAEGADGGGAAGDMVSASGADDGTGGDGGCAGRD